MVNNAFRRIFVTSAAEIVQAKLGGEEFMEIPAPIPEALGAIVCKELTELASPTPLRIDCGKNAGLCLALLHMDVKYLRIETLIAEALQSLAQELGADLTS